ncbi:hypothetical protein VB264_04695 [Arcicella aquatica]|uniref:Lipocalin-like domain-containing protein n=1 Tax=Arcicella aquatica TaxID=217141 RepID=A0ABU5QJ63_9BACT|nr:hypothetical protein [Arcicella aquatica]MEA5257073.1 hypothetical protein [Arcicella aquatica]
MKKILVLMILCFFSLISCKSDIATEPKSIVGKWIATGQMQTKNTDGGWSDWYVPQTLVAVPVSIWEFTSDGRFLRDGKAGGTCCFAGNKYLVSGNKISFTELASPCAAVFCMNCNNWSFEFTNKDTLVLKECFSRSKFYKTQ